MEMLAAHISGAPKRPSEIADVVVPEEMESLLMRCLAKDPAQRPGGAEALAAELRALPTAARWREPQARGWWRQHLERGASGPGERPTA